MKDLFLNQNVETLTAVQIETCLSFAELEEARGVFVPRYMLIALCKMALRYAWLRDPRRMHTITVEQWNPLPRATLHGEEADEAIDKERSHD